MSKKERLASLLDRVTDLCFSISELGIGESSEGEVAKPSASVLSPEAPVFKPSGKGKEGVDQEQKRLTSVAEEWDSVPELPSASVDSHPTFSQVVECGSQSGSQSVYVTPVRRVVRATSVDSAESVVTMAGVPPVAGAPPAAAVPPVQPNFATCTAAQFEAYWHALATDNARITAENAALLAGNDRVSVAVLLHKDERNTGRIARLNNQLNITNAAVAAANAQAAARASPPTKWENKDSGPNIREWLPLIEDYLRDTPNAEYLRIASSYLNGKPRSYWVSQWEAYQAQHVDQPYPANARQVFRQIMETGYGLRTPEQSYWDTWNKLSQGSGSVDEYNIAFQQALTNLRNEITDEQVKVERYRARLQVDLKEVCRISPLGTRWANLNAIAEYATIMWPIVESRMKKRQASQPTKSVAGKRKSSGGGSGGSGRSSRAKLSVAISDEQYAKDMEGRLCHKCHQSGHIARDCDQDVPDSKGKGQKGGKKFRKDFQKD